MTTQKREVIIKMRGPQREAITQYYKGRTSYLPLRRALELPDTQSIHMKLTPEQVDELLKQVEQDYEQAISAGGQRGLLLRNAMFIIRNTLALVQRYGITGDEL